jgi:two-component system chemotaxis response regulator CheY
VVGEASDGDEVMEEYKRLQPDVVTMDIVMPRRSGIDAVKGIVALDSSACVVMCSALGQETLVEEAMEAGASGFLLRQTVASDLIMAVRAVRQNRLFISPIAETHLWAQSNFPSSIH